LGLIHDGKAKVIHLLGRLGYDLLPNRLSEDGRYDVVRPRARLSPWNVDRDFAAVRAAVAAHTYVDLYRLHELWQLAAGSAPLTGALVEVGTWRGGSGALIAASARRAGILDPIYLCDTFRGVVKAGDRDPFYEGGEHADTSREVVEELCSRLGLSGVEVLEGVFPEETARRIPTDVRVRFCHIDVDVHDSARDAFDWAWPRLVPGACVVFDDYGAEGCSGVTELVDAQRGLPDRVVIHNLNGHGIVVRTG
jgi:O-methyltransferase